MTKNFIQIYCKTTNHCLAQTFLQLITLTNAENLHFIRVMHLLTDLSVRLIITPLLKYTSLFRKKPKEPIGLIFRSIKLLPLFTCSCVQNNQESEV